MAYLASMLRSSVFGFAILGCSLFEGTGAEPTPNPAMGGAPPALTGGSPGAVAGSSPAGTTNGGSGGGSGGSAGNITSAGGSSGGGTTSGGAPPVLGPPYAFPQNKRSQYCVYPAGVDANHARAAYERWKRELVTAEGASGFLRVRRPNNEEDTTVSEGIAYGMILSVVMGDQPVFDGLWKYSQRYLNEHGLMDWRIDASGMVTGTGAATDADEDMAWALILADKKWGGQGSLAAPYLMLAKTQIDRIWQHEIDHGRGELLLAGDSWGEVVAVNPSYFAPNQYRLFGVVSGNVAGWNKVIDTGYTMLNASLSALRGNAQNGLVPAWTDASGAPAAPFEGAPLHYQYDSARTPFRIAMDYCDYGEPRAKAYLDKVTAFFANVGAANITDGYALDGTPRPENPATQAALFVGAATVGAMSDARYRPLLDQGYQLLVTKELFPPSYYYNMSWQVFSLLMLSGNLFDYTLH